jgi:hypothetical protein
MLHFNYALDSELEVAPGRLPSGIQTQAFEVALSRIGERYRATTRMLGKTVAGMRGKTAFDGLSKGWQERLSIEVLFLNGMPSALMRRARFVTHAHAGNAVTQSLLERNWNLWAPVALRAYSEALDAFAREVNLAISNATTNDLPGAFQRLAIVAGQTPLRLAGVRTSL